MERVLKRRQGLFVGFVILAVAAAFVLAQCSKEAEDGVADMPDYRTVLTAGGGITVPAADTAKEVSFTGVRGLELSKADFGVTGGGAIDRVTVDGDTVTITVTFEANMLPSAKVYNVVVASTSSIARGDANVRIIHLGTDGAELSHLAWTKVPNKVFGYSAHAVTYGNGMFVAAGTDSLGMDSKLVYSTDGITWYVVNDTLTYYVETVTFANGMFVSGGSSSNMAYSADGITWTKKANVLGSDYVYTTIEAITYGNGTLVVGGVGVFMGYSSDSGGNWAYATTNPLRDGPQITAVTYGNGRFVAANYNGRIAYSSNVAEWTEAASTFGGSSIWAITYGNGMFVAGGSDGKMAYSADGITWTAVEDSAFGGSGIWAVTYGGGMFVAGGSDGKMAYSADGITWTAVEDSAFGDSVIWAITYGNNRFVAVGDSGKIAYSNQIE